MIVEQNIGNNGEIIKKCLIDNNNCFVGRLQGIEADCLLYYNEHKCLNKQLINCLYQNTGFYCNTTNVDEILKYWYEVYMSSILSCTILYRLEFNTWDSLIKNSYDNIYVFSCASLHLWMPALNNKKILVISPFEKSILEQYPKRKNLFSTGKQNNFEYPNFELKTLKSPNTIKGNEPFPHNNWKETFEYLCDQISNIDFEIAVLGCGSYGMPLAHYIKKIGKSSIYAGAYSQVMFGIKGSRWNIDGNPHKSYWNEHWKWPDNEEVPKNHNNVENSCYW
jgi:hypothetical protein